MGLRPDGWFNGNNGMPPTIVNFGGNVRFEPAAVLRPADERGILEIVRGARGRRIRVVGRLHSWSEGVRTADILLDLRRLDGVEVVRRDGEVFARVGAGTPVKRIVRELGRFGWTLPSLGLIDEQSIAGAVATGTHGSGSHSLSHHVRGMRVVQTDSVGNPVVRQIESGSELWGARCSLGCLGIVVSVDLAIRPQYLIEEHFVFHRDLASALAQESAFPLQQFYLIPWQWRFVGQHRREVSGPRVRRRFARLFGLYFFLVFDLAMHWLILAAIRLIRSDRLVKFLYRVVVPAFVVRNWRVVDRSERILTMQHELFRHIEIEMFVRRSQLPAMLQWTEWLLETASGEEKPLPEGLPGPLSQFSAGPQCRSLKGQYTHHYPVCIRRVLPDATLISMTAGWDEPGYAVSLISYSPPSAREGFFRFAELLAESSIRHLGARAHWGKYHGIAPGLLLQNCHDWEGFRQQVEAADPKGTFRNDWTEALLGAGQRPRG